MEARWLPVLTSQGWQGYGDNGKENGNYCSTKVILGLYKDNGKENGNFCDTKVIVGLYKDNGTDNGDCYI